MKAQELEKEFKEAISKLKNYGFTENQLIAMILDFEIAEWSIRIPGIEPSLYKPQWVYPDRFKRYVYGVPVTDVPDFLEMIDAYCDFVQKHSLVAHEYTKPSSKWIGSVNQ